MGVKLSDLASGTRTVDVLFGAQKFTVTYRLAERTPANVETLVGEAIADTVTRMVCGWSLEDEHGAALPVTEENIAQVPIPVLRAIGIAILGDNGLGEAASSSDAG